MDFLTISFRRVSLIVSHTRLAFVGTMLSSAAWLSSQLAYLT